MTKLDNLIDWFGNKTKVIVALSGGVDSALVAYAAFQKLGHSAIAVTADYKTLSKEELETAKQICSEIGIKQFIVDGTNLDDLGDYRPGIEALKRNGIRSPLVETNFTKNEIRRTAKLIGLSVYDKPSNSCLASRIPWGQKITTEKLTRIELGETIVKQITK